MGSRTFSVEGVVRDSLRVSDAEDLSQLTAVECIKLARSVGVSPHVSMLYVSTGTINTDTVAAGALGIHGGVREFCGENI